MTKKIYGAVLATLILCFAPGCKKTAAHKEQGNEPAGARDSVDSAVKAKKVKRAQAATEHGEWLVEHIRAGRVIATLTAPNFLADEGETFIIDCVTRNTNCPTAFTMSLLSTSATPAENSTWAGLLANELVSGSGASGYAAAALTRDSTGWPTLDTVASGTGGCTETLCARVSTAQVVITATANWTVSARYLAIRATVGGNQKLMAVAQLSADRQLQNADQLNLTYRLVQQ